MDSLANVFGRGTPAGEALYRCYTKPTKPSTYDKELAAAWAEERSRQQSLQEEQEGMNGNGKWNARKGKNAIQIALPRVGQPKKLTKEQMAEFRLRHLPHRKSEKVIQAELDQFAPPSPPSYRKPALTSQEKDRLTEIMEYGYVLPEPGTFTGAQRAKLRKINREVALRDQFEHLQREADEIRRVLAQLSLQQTEKIISDNNNNNNNKRTFEEEKENLCVEQKGMETKKVTQKSSNSNAKCDNVSNVNVTKKDNYNDNNNSNVNTMETNISNCTFSPHMNHQSNKLVKQKNGMTVVQQCIQEQELNTALRTIVSEMELVDAELRELALTNKQTN